MRVRNLLITALDDGFPPATCKVRHLQRLGRPLTETT
jgi:hypothetical protein